MKICEAWAADKRRLTRIRKMEKADGSRSGAEPAPFGGFWPHTIARSLVTREVDGSSVYADISTPMRTGEPSRCLLPGSC